MNNWTDVENGTNLIRLVNWSDTLVEPVPDETYNILCAYITFVTVPAIITNGIFICASYKSKVSIYHIGNILKHATIGYRLMSTEQSWHRPTKTGQVQKGDA